MTALRILLWRIRGLWLRGRAERDLAEEIDFHLAMAGRDAERAGLTHAEARSAALRQFGGVDQTKERYRDARGLPSLESFVQDIRHGFRDWRRTPGVWATAVVALALGVGANATIFSTVRALVVRPFASFEQDRAVIIGAVNPRQGVQRERLSHQEFLALSERTRSMEVTAAVNTARRVLRGAGEPEDILIARVSPGFFTLSHSRPLLGRYPTAEETLPGAQPVIVLSHATWLERFGGSREVLGRPVRLDETTYSVIGVAPEDTWFPSRTVRAWIPLILQRSGEASAGRSLLVLGRLKPGAALEDAQKDCEAAVAAARAQDPQSYAGWSLKVRTLYEGLFQPNDRTAIVVLYVLSAGVLLIACANVANLLLARSLGRRREQAVRLSAGATRGRLIRQSLTEALLLAIPAGVLGLAFSFWSAQVLLHSLNTDVQLPAEMIDRDAIRFTMLLALGSVFLFAGAPALLAGRFDLTSSLKEGGARSGSSRGSHWMRRIFVVAQTCLALALVGAAVLTAKGVYGLHRMPIGFDTRNLMYVKLDPPVTGYPAESDARGYVRRAVAAVKAAPGVSQASALDSMPHVDGDGRACTFLLEGQAEPRLEDRQSATFYVAMPEAMETLGLPLIRGRQFTAHDDGSAQRVVIVNRTAAEKLWPGGDAVGRRIRLDSLGRDWFTVVGISGDVRRSNLTEPVRPQFFVPWAQSFSRAMVVAVRTDATDNAARAVRNAIRTVEPDDPLTLRSAEWEIHNDLTGARALTVLFAIFAALALFMAALGLFSVVAQSARERTHEVGVRVALGATPAAIVRLMMSESALLTAIGLAAGCIVLVGIGLALAPMLAQPVADPFTFAVSGAVLAAVAGIAGLMPARLAARADASRILRAG